MVNLFLDMEKLIAEKGIENLSEDEINAFMATANSSNLFASVTVKDDTRVYTDKVVPSMAGLYMGMMSGLADSSEQTFGLFYELVGSIAYHQLGYKGAKTEAKRAESTINGIAKSALYAVAHPLEVGSDVASSMKAKWDKYEQYKAEGKYAEAHFVLGGLIPDAVEVAGAAYGGGVGVFKIGTQMASLSKSVILVAR